MGEETKPSSGDAWLTDSVMESLADIEHKRWASWQEYAFSKCPMNTDGTATIPAWAVENWTRQINTPYADLTEKEKESDRREVRGYLPTIEAALKAKGTESYADKVRARAESPEGKAAQAELARSEALEDAKAFLENITLASGPYFYLNGTGIVADAYALLRRLDASEGL